MKHLQDYIFEALAIFEEENKNNQELVNKVINILGSKENAKLETYVEKLNALLKDNHAKAILTKLFGSDNVKKKYSVEFNGETKKIPASKLHPTQTEIDINKSIVYPFLNTKNAESAQKYKDKKDIIFDFPLITFNGQYVVDGHHRWSGVYSFNPDCKIECFDLTIKRSPDGVEITPQTVLKIAQACLAAKRAKDGQGNIPAEQVEGANLFKLDEDKIKETINSFCTGDVYKHLSPREKEKAGNPDNMKEATKKLLEIFEFKDNKELIDFIADNLENLQDKNKGFALKGNPRGVMPQTDRGGDNPKEADDAMPNKKGSALNKLVTGKINIKAVPHNEK